MPFCCSICQPSVRRPCPARSPASLAAEPVAQRGVPGADRLRRHLCACCIRAPVLQLQYTVERPNRPPERRRRRRSRLQARLAIFRFSDEPARWRAHRPSAGGRWDTSRPSRGKATWFLCSITERDALRWFSIATSTFPPCDESGGRGERWSTSETDRSSLCPRIPASTRAPALSASSTLCDDHVAVA